MAATTGSPNASAACPRMATGAPTIPSASPERTRIVGISTITSAVALAAEYAADSSRKSSVNRYLPGPGIRGFTMKRPSSSDTAGLIGLESKSTFMA